MNIIEKEVVISFLQNKKQFFKKVGTIMNAIKRQSKLLSIILAIAMIFGIFAIMPMAASAEETEALYITFDQASRFVDIFGTKAEGDKVFTVTYDGNDYEAVYLGVAKDTNFPLAGVNLPKDYKAPITIKYHSNKANTDETITVSDERNDNLIYCTLGVTGKISRGQWWKPSSITELPPIPTEKTEESEALYIAFDSDTKFEQIFGTKAEGDKLLTVNYDGTDYEAVYLGMAKGTSLPLAGVNLPKDYKAPITIKYHSNKTSADETVTVSAERNDNLIYCTLGVTGKINNTMWWKPSSITDLPPIPGDVTDPTDESTEPTTEATEPSTQPDVDPNIPKGYEPFYCLIAKDDFTERFGENFESGNPVLTVTYNEKDYTVVYCGEYGKYSGNIPYVVCGAYLPEGYDASLTLSFNDLVLGKTTLDNLKERSGNVLWLRTNAANDYWGTKLWWTPQAITDWPYVPDLVDPNIPKGYEPFYCLFEKQDITKHFGENFESGNPVLTVTYNEKDYTMVYCGEYGEYTTNNPYVVCGVYLPEGYTTPLTLSFNDLLLGETTIEQTDTRKGNVLWITTRPGNNWTTHMWWTPSNIEFPYVPDLVEPQTTEPTTDATEPTTVETEPTTNATEPTTDVTEPTTNTTEPTSNPNPVYEEYILGDADGNGVVNIKDVTYIQLHLAKLLNETANPIPVLAACEVDGDKEVNIKDVTQIQLWLAKFKVEYKIGEVVKNELNPVESTTSPSTDPVPTTPTEPETTVATEPESTAATEPESTTPTDPDSDTITFYVPNVVNWLSADGGSLWIYNDDTQEFKRMMYDNEEKYFYLDIPKDWSNLSIYRSRYETDETTFDINDKWNEETQTGQILNEWVGLGSRGENDCYYITADKEGKYTMYESIKGGDDVDTRTIYFDNTNSKWSKVYIYGWNYGLTEKAVEMKQIEGTNIWYYTFNKPNIPTDGIKAFLFVNKYTSKADKTSWNGASKTADLATQKDKNLFIPKSGTGTSITGTWDVYAAQ